MPSDGKGSSKVSVSKWVLVLGVLFFCAAIVAVGLGVYFGVKCNNKSTPMNTTTAPPVITTPFPVDIRLPTNLYPLDYFLTIQTFLPSPNGLVTYDEKRNFTFNGNLTIFFHCNESTSTITLQTHQIYISNAILYDDNDSVIPLVDPSNPPWDNATQFVVFTLTSGTLMEGNNYTLRINYTGILNDDLAGFYRSSYEEGGKNLWMAVTQFEPTDARRALPCFDEPSFKAVFHLTLIHPADMKAISNAMEQPTTNLTDGWAMTKFNPTPKMSSYLFAMCVAAFDMRSQNSSYNVTFRVWARPSFIEDSWWALDAGPKVLTYYADYFGISFPLEKQDMVAVPDFSAGAMENWGMVTYRERDLLYNNATYGSSNLQRTTIVVTHELAHQWFGDLVTLAWWDDLWLNEGFAEFMEYKGADNVSNDNFEMKYQFVPSEIDLFMGLDQLTSSHPIYDPSLQTPDQINAMFDDISYDKGAAVIHQLEFTVGEDIFKAGLYQYLSTHEYNNAAHQDLWNGIQYAVNIANKTMGWDGNLLNVTEFMNPWILQMGFPVVNVKVDSTNATLSQSRFLLPGNFSVNPQYQTSPYNFTWYIPIRYSQSSINASDMYWVQPYQTTTLTGITDGWLVVNSGVYGLYRVNYDLDNWMKIYNQLMKNHQAIDPRNRAQMLDDALNLAKTGQMPYNLSLSLTTYLNKETNYVPWMSVAPDFGYFQNMFALSASNQYFGKYMKKLVQPLYNHFGWTDNSDYKNVTIHELHAYLINTMFQVGDAGCISQAQYLYNSSLVQRCPTNIPGTSSCSTVDQNLRHTVYCAGISQGTSDDFNYLYRKYPEEQIPVERDNILYGLCCSKAPWALTKLLDEAINPNSTFIRQQDAEYVFQYIGANDVGREILWDYFVSNFQALSDSFSSGAFSLSTIVQAVTQSFNTQSQVDQMEAFYAKYNSSLGTGLAQYVQQIQLAQSNVVWMQTYADEVVEWFKEYTS